MFKNLKLKSIRIKILIPILTVVFIGMSVFGLLTYNSEKKSLTNMMDEITTLKVQETKGLISERESNVNVLKQSLNKYLISITQAIAEELKYTPEDKLNSETERLAKAVGVAEIHVTDGKGVLRWGTVPSFYGFDFSTSDQTKPFLPGLTDKNFALAQEPEPRGTDKQLFQYITVTRKDTTGLVQIGVAPKELEELLDKVNVNNLAKSTKLGKAGYIFILDKEGKMISHPKDSEIGKTLKDYDWGSKIQSSNKGSFTYFDEGIEKYLAFEKTGSYIIAASIPTSEYYDKLKELRNLAVIFTVTAMLLLSIIITIISNKFLINRIKNILNKVSQVGEGNLKVDIKDKSSDELGQLSSGLNNMILNLRNLVSNINGSAIKLNQTADTVAVASDQTSAAALEIANSVNEIAKGTSSQAEEVQNSVNMLEQVTEDIREITSSTKIITEKVSEIDKKNRHSIESINDLKNKFADNKKATKSVNDSIIMLSERSNKIGVITESISAISSQTNLLALNASIEAARAGESGKGFAVVADEVRKLAEQSADAANSIDTLIREIKGDIDHAVKSIDIAGKSVEESDSRLNNTVNNFYSLKESNDSMINLVKKLDEISILLNANTDKVVVAVNSIASVSEESAATTEEISAAAEEQTATFEGIKESTIELRSLSNQLIEVVKSFKIEE